MRRSPCISALAVSLAALTAGLATPAGAQTASPGNYPSNVPAPSNQAAGACQGPDATSNPACAQVTANADGTTADAASAPTRDVVVTGSRIRRPDYETASPIVSLDSNTLQQSGTTNVTDFLTGYPALIGSSTSAQNSGDRAGIGATGLNLLNLRNLGTQRTLVLVDGRRHVGGVPGDASVDINTIPEDLIDRIDVLTGGASAIYGADAVTGVVNFVLKHDFEGITGRAQAGISEQGDAGQRLLTVTAGKNFAGGKGNVAVAYEYGMNDRYSTQDRDYLRGPQAVFFQRNGAYTANTPGSYLYVPYTDLRYADTARNGAVDIDGDGIPEFTGTGAVYDRGQLLPGNAYTVGGSSTSLADYGNDLLPQVERHVVNALAHYDFSPALTLFAEGKFALTRSYSLGQPSFDYYLFVPQDNPYIPANVRAAIDPALGGVLVTRDNFDLGQRGEYITRKTYRTVVGARGDLDDATHYEVSYVFGQTDVTNHFVNDQYTDRFYAAIDAVRNAAGQIVCRVDTPGGVTTDQPYNPTRTVNGSTFGAGQCQPLNIFGEGVASQAALNFVRAETTEQSYLTQHVVSGSLSGDFRHLFSLPGGELGYSLGAEYRREKSVFTPDALEQQGLTFSNKLSPTAGAYDVKEVFAELDAPLLKDRPFFQLVDLAAAIRYSDYSTIGSTTTYKLDATWAPVRDIRFRGTYSYAVRAPNIGELFGGTSQTFEFFDDPCKTENLSLGASTRATNCTALLSAAGLSAAQIAAFEDPRSTNIPGTQSGNADLAAERARTWTAGVVLQPRFLPGLTASFDWYDIKLKSAINTVNAQQLAELCVDQPTIANVFCQSITRQQGTGLINGFVVAPQNVAQFQTAGLDANISYHFKLASLGSFNVKIVGGYLNKLSFVGTPGADPTDELQYPYSPKFQANGDFTFSRGPFTLNYGLSWFDKTYRTLSTQIDATVLAGNPNYINPQYAFYKDRWVHDLYLSIDVNKNFQFYGGVNNFTNARPSYGTRLYPVDAVGRFLFAGARVKLPKF
ncbi:TonB-dependent receptor plug domain-containing protein [uncultured Sphingomonas sp.]|uniref:TonB-dependent receptor plug domain-containing protein n=1 Tax=uncultured Sphingomonas sp. TaxID=158754 RepID=UPI0035CB56A8